MKTYLQMPSCWVDWMGLSLSLWPVQPPRSPTWQPGSCQPLRLPLTPPQEMLAIMKSIYDMMGRHTYPILREDAPLEHVERFFQVSSRGGAARRGGRAFRPQGPLCVPSYSRGRCNCPPPSGWLNELKPSLCPPPADPHLRAVGLLDSESADTPGQSFSCPLPPRLHQGLLSEERGSGSPLCVHGAQGD